MGRERTSSAACSAAGKSPLQHPTFRNIPEAYFFDLARNIERFGPMIGTSNLPCQGNHGSLVQYDSKGLLAGLKNQGAED